MKYSALRIGQWLEVTHRTSRRFGQTGRVEYLSPAFRFTEPDYLGRTHAPAKVRLVFANDERQTFSPRSLQATEQKDG